MLKEILTSCWQKDPSKRISAYNVLIKLETLKEEDFPETYTTNTCKDEIVAELDNILKMTQSLDAQAKQLQFEKQLMNVRERRFEDREKKNQLEKQKVLIMKREADFKVQLVDHLLLKKAQAYKSFPNTPISDGSPLEISPRYRIKCTRKLVKGIKKGKYHISDPKLLEVFRGPVDFRNQKDTETCDTMSKSSGSSLVNSLNPPTHFRNNISGREILQSYELSSPNGQISRPFVGNAWNAQNITSPVKKEKIMNNAHMPEKQEDRLKSETSNAM